jgi:Pyruvate/2-oxoacid:ferredoxin oxidoreductase gamma subunit
VSVDLTLKIGGEAGQGMQTIGYVLSKTLARGGFHLFANQDYMSRIRGGHNFFQIRVKGEPMYALSEEVDILIALDKATVKIHRPELKEKGVIIFDGEHIDIPPQPPHLLSVPLERLAREFGLVAEQAEDEIAAINMAIGASFAGVRAIVATSGGGFSLMVEALGLVGMTETPLVIIEAQRPGHGTGTCHGLSAGTGKVSG